MQETICALLIAATTLAVQPGSPSDWIGVWQGELDTQPSITLTLAEDTGTLQGTLVLNIISRDGGLPRVIAHEPHVLMNPRIDGVMLSFEAKRIDDSGTPIQFSVELTSRQDARIHCLNCGENAPIVEITKLD